MNRAAAALLSVCLAGLALVLVVMPAAADDPVTVYLYAEQDAHTYNLEPDTNFNDNPLLGGWQSAPERIRWVYIEFPLDTIGPGVTLDSASLCVYVEGLYSGGAAAGSNWNYHLIDSAWSESSITYNTVPSLQSGPSLNYINDTPGYDCMDVRADVQDYIDGSNTFYGWRMSRLAAWQTLEFASSEDSTHPPYIVLTGEGLVLESQSEYDSGVRIYYPLTEGDQWAHYQTYSETTWYGNTYAYYNIWQTRPGAHAFAVTDLYIDGVSINQFGYVIDAHVWSNYWNITSTTLRYEGLSSVNVAPGQLVGAQCDLGEVAYQTRLEQYQLLLYSTYPTTTQAFNPVPWMNLRPEYGVCLPVGDDELPPDPGLVEQFPLEACAACSVPSSWSNFGQWIIWLACMLRNIYLCHVITWFNALIGVNVAGFGRLVDMGPWLGGLYNNGLTWTDGLFSGGIDYLAALYSDLTARADNLGYIVMSYAGGTTVYYTQQPGTNLWDALVSFLRLQIGFVDMLTALIDGFFALATALIDLTADLVQLLVLILSAAITGLTGSGSSDMIANATGLTTVDCTQTGVWATSGPSAGKAACYFLAGLQMVDIVLVQTPLAYLPYVIIGILALGLVFWMAGQFREIIPA